MSIKRLVVFTLLSLATILTIDSCSNPAIPSTPIKVLPFKLQWEDHKDFTDLIDLSKIAAKEWNDKLNYKVFSFSSGGKEVLLTYTNINDLKFGGFAYGSGENADKIEICTIINREFVLNIFLHEMGHIIGLDHSLKYDDIMYKKGSANITLSENDINRAKEKLERLKNVYLK